MREESNSKPPETSEKLEIEVSKGVRIPLDEELPTPPAKILTRYVVLL
jgi:hypothetical protein